MLVQAKIFSPRWSHFSLTSLLAVFCIWSSWWTCWRRETSLSEQASRMFLRICLKFTNLLLIWNIVLHNHLFTWVSCYQSAWPVCNLWHCFRKTLAKFFNSDFLYLMSGFWISNWSSWSCWCFEFQAYNTFCQLSIKPELTFPQFEDQYKTISDILITRKDGSLMIFHPTLRDWLLKQSTDQDSTTSKIIDKNERR